MRRLLAGVVATLAAATAVAVPVVTSGPAQSGRAWVGANKTFSLCISTDCGAYAAALHWDISWPGHTATGYYVFLNGIQEADVLSSPWAIDGGDCGTAVTLGVEAHDGSGNTSQLYTSNYTISACTGFPLKVSASGRYLQTAGNQPFLMVGDSPQSLITQNSETSADSYLADRQSHGFNTVWVNLLCDSYTFCTGCDGSTQCGALTANYGETYDAILPFTATLGGGTYNLLDPTASYFTRAHNIISQAKADGLEVVLDPIETGGWEATLVANGDGTVSTTDSDYKYGQYLGNQFKDLTNVLWMFGNDFQDYSTNTAANNDLLSVAKGITNTDPTALQTLELNYSCTNALSSSSLNDAAWASQTNLNQSYTYSPTYAENLTAYGQTPTMPVFMGEANYEFESNCNYDGGSSRNLRLQEWWTVTSGATGQLYGSKWTDRIANGWLSSNIDSPGVTQLGYLTTLFNGLSDWPNLAPDTGHTFLYCTASGTACGTYASTGSFGSNNYVTAALASDGRLGLAYFPDPAGVLTTATVNLAAMSGSITARWYDPSTGTFTSISGSPFVASGTHSFTPPGANGAGDADWILVLQGA